ncbi:hypothetical protein [Gaetbulibacter saemankumensis]|uniref:hypothetical protein n=1 Tax=Gaetbulibacter saemankumensis TaxID=311208 RepID=UPI00040F031E|nr:hypothetical protein [Gaetbulibacter saemankumensis]
MIKQKTIYIVIVFLITTFASYGQYTSISLGDKLEHYRDSLKRTPYEWRFPIMGDKLRKMGFDLPYPNGLGLNITSSQLYLGLSDAFVGFDEGDLTPIDNFARFRSLKADVIAATLRYDVWLLPFWNVYGIVGEIYSGQEVSLGLPFEMTFNTRPKTSTTVGWGTVVAGGVGPLIVSGDFTMAWTYSSSLDKPSRSIVVGGRIGHLIRFPNKPEMRLALLVGAQYLGLSRPGEGALNFDKNLGITPEKKERALEQLNGWYDGLSDREQEVLEPFYSGASRWLSSDDPILLHYRFNKFLNNPVSLSTGFNYQINHRYTITGIYSFLGSRKQLVIGLGYRFGFKGKNILSGLTL